MSKIKKWIKILKYEWKLKKFIPQNESIPRKKEQDFPKVLSNVGQWYQKQNWFCYYTNLVLVLWHESKWIKT